MSERLTKITMQAFRGVRDAFEIPLAQGQPLLIYGDNGTGKSSLADAIEWYFTGDIELLSKEGREGAIRHQGATKEQHTLVAIETNGELGGVCTLKGPNKAAIEAAARETYLLRGRTIADFVDKSKGEKWTSLQQLLGLGAIDELRADLQKARSEIKRNRDEAATKVKQAEAALRAAKVEPKEAAIVAALGELAVASGIEARPTIDQYFTVNLTELIETPRSSGSSKKATITALTLEIAGSDTEIDTSALETWNETLESSATIDAAHVDLLGAAARYVKAHPDGKNCPVCDKKIAYDTLGTRLTKTLSELAEQSTRLIAAEREAREVADALADLHKDRLRWATKARELGIEIPAVPDSIASKVTAAISERGDVPLDKVKATLRAFGKWDEAARTALGSETFPAEDAPQKNQAMAFAQLLVAAKQWADASAVHASAEHAFKRADVLFETYQTEQRTYVQEILEKISAEIARLFSRLHPVGAVGSVAVETWADKGIELAVDFHGQRQRPPHGVLSESYMNSVAIVLFLAMARTFNEHLGFLVLDDVVNSFDFQHRGRLGDLLLEEFQDWQLVVLTHDRYFFEQIRRKVKGWATYQILGWSYDRGPALREHRGATDVDDALELLEHGAIGDAARRGRRGLESTLKELCEGLEVPLPYRRGNENEFREIGALMNGLRRALKEDSKSKAFLASIDNILRALEADAQSVLNAEAHASDAGASSAEVRSTLERVRAFDALWTCPQCSSRVWKEQGVRCRCGKTPFPPPIAQAPR